LYYDDIFRVYDNKMKLINIIYNKAKKNNLE